VAASIHLIELLHLHKKSASSMGAITANLVLKIVGMCLGQYINVQSHEQLTHFDLNDLLLGRFWFLSETSLLSFDWSEQPANSIQVTKCHTCQEGQKQ
jgi:hypothetical protein